MAGSPIEGRSGAKAIEEYRSYEEFGDDCDWVVSRSEFNDDGPLVLRRVLRKFERLAVVVEVTVGGKVIGTTGEHPVFVRGRGWSNANELQVGDEVRLMAPGWRKVESMAVTDRVEPVYNLEIEEDHTYFVGCDEWGFSVWAHNQCKEFVDAMIEAGVDSKANAVKQAYKRIMQKPLAEREALFSKYIEHKLGDLSPAPRESLLSTALAAEPLGKKGGLRANVIGGEGEAASRRIYGPKNNETFQVNGRGRKPDHILETDPQTGLPRAVVEAKAHAEYYLSRQLRDYLRLVGPDGYVILAVPKSGAKIAQTLYNHPRIHVAHVLPPK